MYYNIVYDAFEHWKELVKLSCFCEDALSSHPQYFLNFISKFLHSKRFDPASTPCTCAIMAVVVTAMLHFQLKEIQEDFFVDIVSRNNFLTATLQVKELLYYNFSATL